MASTLQPVRGTHDLLPDSYLNHQQVIAAAQATAVLHSSFTEGKTQHFTAVKAVLDALGEDELKNQTITVKHLETGTQETIPEA